MKHALSLVALAGLAACATVQAQAPRTDGRAAIGESTYVDGPVVTPREVIEDSRCPMNARCIWAGRVVLRVDVTGGNWRRTLDLTLGEPQPVADGALTLVSVMPEQHIGREIAPRDYRFAFEFQGGI